MSENTKPAAVPVRHVEVDENREGQRLDNFLLTLLKGVPKSRIYRCLRKGEVRVNRGRVGPDYRLQAGDVVRIPPIRTSSEDGPKPRADDFEWLEHRILFEDEYLLAVDKPAGLAVHAGSGVNVGLIEAMRAVRSREPMIELVHRLDRETSGCLLLAKNRQVLTALHRQLRDGGIRKHYLALVQGRLRHARTVTAALERRARGGERMVETVDEGKESESRFRPRGQFGDATLVEIELLTGRTHQARVHATHIGHPIAGDEKYGDREFNRLMRALGLRRVFLHAARLEAKHPITHRNIVFESPLPIELSAVVDKLHDKSV